MDRSAASRPSSVRRRRLGLLTAFSFASWGPTAVAVDPVPIGPPFVVAADNQGVQKEPRLAIDDRGDLVFCWSRFDVYLRRYVADGTPKGGDVWVNPTVNKGEQDETWVAIDPWSGDFMVAWSDRHGNDGFDMGIGGRFYASSGAPRGPEFLLNDHHEFSQFDPRAAFARSGDVVVVWTDAGLDGSAGAMGRVFDRFGAPVGPEFLLNAPNSFTQIQPAVACEADGDFVAVWVDASGQYGPPREIVARRFDRTGQPLGAEFPVATIHDGMQRFPSVARAGRGDFVVVFQDESGNDGDGFGVFGRAFYGDGTPKGPQFLVPTTTAGDQRNPQVSCDWVGNFTVVWEDFSLGHGEIRARMFDRFGQPLGAEFPVAPAPLAGDQTWPTVAVAQSGHRVAFSWFDADSDAWGRIFRVPWLAASPPPAAGQISTLHLTLTGADGEAYLLLPFLLSSPANPLPVDGPRQVPIAPDPLLLFVLSHPSSVLGTGFQGTVGPGGQAAATLSLPALPGLSGTSLAFVAVTLDGAGAVDLVSDPETVTIQ